MVESHPLYWKEQAQEWQARAEKAEAERIEREDEMAGFAARVGLARNQASVWQARAEQAEARLAAALAALREIRDAYPEGVQAEEMARAALKDLAR